MSKVLAVAALGLAFTCTGFIASASAQPRGMSRYDEARYERALVQRYTSHHKCDGAGAPAWGKASMARWNAAHSRQYRNWN